MRLAIHIGRLLVDTVRYSVVTRRLALAVAVIVGLALVALALTAQAVAPLALYPFA